MALKPAPRKADRAVIAAHEAGMHDKHPKPDQCRECAREARER